MTVCIAVRAKGSSVVCMSDSALSFGNNRMSTPTIKGERYGTDFVMWSGDVWCAQKILREDPEELTFQETCDKFGKKYRDEEKHPSVPVDFLRVTPDGDIQIMEGNGSCIGGFDYACIGHGSFTAWPLLDALHKRLPDNHTVHAIKKMLFEVGMLTEKYDSTVYKPFIFETIDY